MRRSLFTRLLLFIVAGMASSFVNSFAWCQTPSSTTEALARRSDVVAVGHVASLLAQWDENHSRIRTQVTIAVSENVKGTSSGSSFTLVVPGGEVDGVGEMYSDMPVFRKDEDVVVFARRTPQGTFRVEGGVEGKYTVVKDAATGTPMVSNRLSVAEFASTTPESCGVQCIETVGAVASTLHAVHHIAAQPLRRSFRCDDGSFLFSWRCSQAPCLPLAS